MPAILGQMLHSDGIKREHVILTQEDNIRKYSGISLSGNLCGDRRRTHLCLGHQT
jgi:hypothetical protein